MPSRANAPAFRIWVEGRPQSAQKRGATERYTARIRDAAAAVVPIAFPSFRGRVGGGPLALFTLA
jgi:hypothetical protein